MHEQGQSVTGNLRGRTRRVLRSLLVLGTVFPAVHIIATGPAGNAQPVLVEEYENAVEDSSAFRATAYCDYGPTKSGKLVAKGMVAGDPSVLPLGSVICVEGSTSEDGLYQVMDTGRLVKGKRIDIYIPSLEKALEFGLQRVRVTVLRRGFPVSSPSVSSPSE